MRRARAERATGARRVRGARPACALLCLLLAAPATLTAAQWRLWDREEEEKAWQEIEAPIPAYPQAHNLVAVDVGSATSHQFFVDAPSVSLGQDGVMRYTVVIKASGGATNVAFEGMRCETRERRVYALGRGDGTWVPARDSAWQRIVPHDLAPYRFVLYREYFCPTPARPPSAKQALDALRRGARPPPPES